MAGVIVEGICSLLAEIYNIEIWKKLPILYNGDFSLPRKRTLRFSDRCNFCKVHSIGPRNMCIHFENNPLRIDDLKKK